MDHFYVYRFWIILTWALFKLSLDDDPWGRRQKHHLLENSKIEGGLLGTDQQLLSIIQSSGSLDGIIFVFVFASSPLLFFSLERGKTLFDTILPDGKGEKEGAQFRTNHGNLSLGARARGKILWAQLSLGGVLKLSRHPIINPPHLSWLFSFFLFQFEICPPHSSSLIPQWFDGGKSVRRMQGGGRWSSLAGRVSSLSTYLNLARFRNIWNWKFLPSSYSGLLACFCSCCWCWCWCWCRCSAVNEIFRIWQAVFCSCDGTICRWSNGFRPIKKKIHFWELSSKWFWLSCMKIYALVGI